MNQKHKTRIKICCIKNAEEAKIAIKLGADAIGLVSEMPSGPGVISDETVRKIAAVTPPPIATFLLTCKYNSKEIISQAKKCGANTIQIVDALTKGNYLDIKESLPGRKIVQVIHVTSDASVEEALNIAQHVDALLLDSGNPNLAIKELGGTGRVHNWSISKKICQKSPVPVFLAGGLNPDNIAEAIKTVHPFGVDVCSGVRTDGQLDPVKLKKFIDIIRNL